MAVIEFDIPAAKSVLEAIDNISFAKFDVRNTIQTICSGLETTWQSESAREFQELMAVQLNQWGFRTQDLKRLRDSLAGEIAKWEQIAARLGP
jgi:hypothetical protein